MADSNRNDLYNRPSSRNCKGHSPSGEKSFGGGLPPTQKDDKRFLIIEAVTPVGMGAGVVIGAIMTAIGHGVTIGHTLTGGASITIPATLTLTDGAVGMAMEDAGHVLLRSNRPRNEKQDTIHR
ncbi:hypothetical protein UY3_02022 [Chelonia mydas]|uniref:Uncharacterized protein n=1 Tax=Chelonia mydas TaxID=8469 RepID=M7CIE1_CHEMY|nr:hypothetical protein UY3_02022 [Chelonia mydas]